MVEGRLHDPGRVRAHRVATTALRIIAVTLEKGIDVNVFAYEGAVSLTVKDARPRRISSPRDTQRCVAAAEAIRRAEVVDVLERHDQIWHW